MQLPFPLNLRHCGGAAGGASSRNSKMLRTLSMIRLVVDYLKGRRGPRAHVTETVLQRFERGCPFIQYQASGKPRGTLLLIHGVTPRASEDPNLVHLARCIAAFGYRCLTPPLTGLAGFTHDARDIERVSHALVRAGDVAGEPVSVFAFSYGASYALSAAAEPNARSCCARILGFGAYHQLSEALEHQRQLLVKHPDPALDDSDVLYLRYTLLACQRDELGLSSTAWGDIDEALSNFMAQTPLAHKKRALLQHAGHFDYVELMQRYQRRNLPAVLSPAGRLHQVACPVSLLHDPDDRFVPASHLNRIRAELDARTQVEATKALKTTMLSHVQVNPLINLVDTVRFLRLLAPSFEA